RMWVPRRMPRCRRTIRLTLLLRPARQERRVGRLGDDDLRFRPFLLEHPRYSLERAAGSDARHEKVELLASKIPDDLARCRPLVDGGVCLVLELPREKPPMLLRERVRFADHPRSALGRGSE